MKVPKAGQFLSILFPEVLETANISIYAKLLANEIIIKGVLSTQQGFKSSSCCFCKKKYSCFS